MRRVDELVDLYGAASASAADLLCDRHDPAKIAYRFVAPDLSARDLTYRELRQESEQLAAGFAAIGVKPGDRVATLMGKSRAYVITLTAIWRLGAVHVPLFTAFAPAAIALRLIASGATLVVCDEAQRSKLEPGEAIPAGAPWRVVTTGPAAGGDIPFDRLLQSSSPAPARAALGGHAPIIQIYTSGTTGPPKGVVVPLRAVAAFQMYAEYGLGLQLDDRFWNAADPGWAYGLYFGVIASLTTGVESFLFESGFSPEATLDVLERYGITNLAAAPTVYRSIRSSGARPRAKLALRCASSAGEPLTPEVNEWAGSSLGLQVHDHYGQTETGMLINNHQHPDLQRPLKPGSMGHASPGWRAVILESGADELASPGELGRVAIDLDASPLAWFRGYLNDPSKSAEKFSADGRWYFTGDIGRIDEDGNFYFSARDDDVIIMAGYRIGPTDVESVILAHPAVAECAVVATPDEVRGEVLEAVVVLREGLSGSEELTRQLQTKVKTDFAAHAYPRRIHYVEALPKTPSGKIQRFLVRQRLRDGNA
jgi:acetyl-CoA synthetase